ncbi:MULTISPECIES: GFA family protein [unclassified Rhizobium]|uniref:GFA family protein n=1 Tax=unclassified Rhizobium TaxID=2613769 RepID=UPI0009EBE321|nr:MULTISPECIES: GFA family protein [unclassified Rhizobium]
MEIRIGACACGAVKFKVMGNPFRVGLCHCHDCRRETGSAFATFGVWPRSAFTCNGNYATHSGRSFCPKCGSRLFALTDEEAEIKLGSLDSAPFDIRPSYELWTKRRERWLLPLPRCEQYDEDRIKGR